MNVKGIILHCTNTKEGQEVTVDDVNSWHVKRGLKKIGYHYLIYLDGSIHTGRAETEKGAHCTGHNDTIGISYVGGCNKYKKHKDTRTAAQKSALVSLVKQIMTKYNLTKSQVHCHYEFANKACPCFKIESFRDELDGNNSSIPAIQNSSITTSVITYTKFKKGWLGGKSKWTINSPMGIRKHPVSGKRKYHGGNDISTPTGTKIYAPCDGIVEKQHQGKKGAGLYVVLKHENGYWFYFMHLSKVLKTGKVKEGDLIAETGGDPQKDPQNAGGSTGPHLHFEVRKNGDRSKRVDGKYFVSDTWVSKYTGAIITSGAENMPEITTTGEDYSQMEQSTIEQEFAIDEADIVPILEQDVSGETDWGATEDDEDDDEDVINEQERTLKEGLVSGIWQIMKLVMDEDVANLRIRDAATSLQQGSLINFFQKVCQQPFVEFFGDTYGDQYYFLARRPPFDQEGMKKTMVAQGLFDVTKPTEVSEDTDYDGKNTVTRTIYDIYEDDVVSSNISFNNQNIYSWYQFIPIYELGAPSELQYLIPAVLFPEYASIWGSKSLSIRSQYRNFRNSNISDAVKNGNKSEQGDVEVRHSIHDLKYIIESNAYNPFVRQGSITILGNRKIKRGTFIRIFWNSLDCPEIFYVESVSQNYSIGSGGVNRTTTLTLSHGMLSDYMFDNAKNSTKLGLAGVSEDKRITMSYFNIIDFGDYDKSRDNIDMDSWRKIISKWKVNTSVFMFFLRKTHFLTHLYDKGILVIGQNKSKQKATL